MTEQPEPRPLRLLVVDDHEVVRQGLVSLLTNNRDPLDTASRSREKSVQPIYGARTHS